MGDYVKPVGRLAVDRYDFQNHIQGSDFNHTSQGILLDPVQNIDGVDYSDLGSAISAIATYIQADRVNGAGFITLPDGYNTYTYPSSDVYYDSSIPSINAILNDILTNTDNPLNSRIKNGGIILLKSGTYKITDTIEIPAGISIIGEGYGTKIINQCSTPRALFKFKQDLTRTVDGGIDANEKFMFSRESALANLIIGDNFVEPKFLGDLTYLEPQSYTSVAPLVSVCEGASLTCDGVKFVGKTAYLLGNLDKVTSYAVGIDSTVPVATGTLLTIKNCFIDGFAISCIFTPSGGCKNYLNYLNNKVRAYGYFNNDVMGAQNQTFIQINDVNAVIQQNYFYGYGTYTTTKTIAYVVAPVLTPVFQANSKILISGNDVSINRSSNSINLTYNDLGSAVSTGYVALVYGNNFQGATFNINGGIITSSITEVSTSTYTVDSSTIYDYIIMVRSDLVTATINLPYPVNGRTLIIKDSGFNCGTNNITLHTFGGGGNIEGIPVDIILNTSGASWTMVVRNGNWYFI